MVYFYLGRQWLLQQTCSLWVTVFCPEGVSDPVQAGDPEQTGFWWYASGYCQKMKKLLIKLGMFASDDRPKILVLSLDRKTEIALPKRQAVQMGLMAMGCGVPWRRLLWGVIGAQGSAGSRAVWALWDVVPECSAAHRNLNGTTQPCRSQIHFFQWCRTALRIAVCAMLWKQLMTL